MYGNEKARTRTTSEARRHRTALGDRIDIRLKGEEKEIFSKAAAANQNMSLSQWLRLAAWRVINEHGGKVLR